MTTKKISAIDLAARISRNASENPRSITANLKQEARDRIIRRAAEELSENVTDQEIFDWLFRLSQAFPMNFVNAPPLGKALEDMDGEELLEEANPAGL